MNFDSDLVKWYSLIADTLTILSVITIFIFGLRNRAKNLTGFRVNLFFIYFLRSFLILAFLAMVGFFITTVYPNLQAVGVWQRIFLYSIGAMIILVAGRLVIPTLFTFSTNNAIDFLNKFLPEQFNLKKHKYKTLKIIKSFYGTKIKEFDITADISKMVTHNTLTIHASNLLVADDPEFGVLKTLKVWYEFDGNEEYESVTEGQTLRIPKPA